MLLSLEDSAREAVAQHVTSIEGGASLAGLHAVIVEKFRKPLLKRLYYLSSTDISSTNVASSYLFGRTW